MTHTPADARASALGRLAAEHQQIDALYEKMRVAASRGIDPRRLRLAWNRLERMLRAHLRAEERWLFLELRAAHQDAIDAFKAGHDQIRERLSAVGSIVDSQSLDDPRVHALMALVRGQASRKRQTLYRWAAREIAEPTLNAMLRFTTDRAEPSHAPELSEPMVAAASATAVEPPPRRAT